MAEGWKTVAARVKAEALILFWLVASPKTEMVKLLTSDQRKKRLTKDEQEVINYKKALDYISQNWLVSPDRVTPKVVITLHDLVCPGQLLIMICPSCFKCFT